MQVLVAAVMMAALGCGGAAVQKITAKSMPDGGTFTGVWHSPQYGEMHMRQSGSAVIGRYEKDERKGRIQGSAQGDLMRFEWTEKRELIAGRSQVAKGHGYFHIVHDEAEGTWKLIGEWGNDASETGGGPWNAVKSPKAKVRLDKEGGEGDGSDEAQEEDGNDYGGRDSEGSSGGELDNL